MRQSDTDLCFLSVSEMADLLRKKTLSPVELMMAHISRSEEMEPHINSWISFTPDVALKLAREAEEAITKGDYLGALHGIPIGLKDVYATRDLRTTYGCKAFEDRVIPQDATVVERLRKSGALLLGKLNLHTLALGATGENRHFGNTRNPWNTEHYTGGSSGGSAAAVASGQCGASMGTDAGGSIRNPASLCGVVGLKTTYGLLSRYGVMKLSYSMEHQGPITKTVRDCALMLDAVAGYDSNDPHMSRHSVPSYASNLGRNVKDLRVGIPKEFLESPMSEEVERAFLKSLEVLRGVGFQTMEVEWPVHKQAYAISNIILGAEVTDSLGKVVSEHAGDVDPAVRTRIQSGFFIPAMRYVQAQRARAFFCQESHRLFKGVDVLAGPTVPITAPKFGDTEISVGAEKMKVMEALTRYLRAYNLNGLPAITIPCGFSDDGLPMGLQLATRAFGEETLLQTAFAYEQATNWRKRTAPLPSVRTRTREEEQK